MFKKSSVLVLAVLLMASVVSAESWELDAAHSSVGFKVSHLVISSTAGNFTKFSGIVEFDGKSFEKGKVEVSIDVASVNTDNADRDKHLRAPDFFDAEKYPEIRFVSKKITNVKGNEFQIVGDLTIRDVTKEVVLDAEFRGSADFMGTTKAGFSATGEINRQDFGVSFSRTMETGGLVVGNTVEITLEVELNKAG